MLKPSRNAMFGMAFAAMLIAPGWTACSAYSHVAHAANSRALTHTQVFVETGQALNAMVFDAFGKARDAAERLLHG